MRHLLALAFDHASTIVMVGLGPYCFDSALHCLKLILALGMLCSSLQHAIIDCPMVQQSRLFLSTHDFFLSSNRYFWSIDRCSSLPCDLSFSHPQQNAKQQLVSTQVHEDFAQNVLLPVKKMLHFISANTSGNTAPQQPLPEIRSVDNESHETCF